jgi:hypothetical protein
MVDQRSAGTSAPAPRRWHCDGGAHRLPCGFTSHAAVDQRADAGGFGNGQPHMTRPGYQEWYDWARREIGGDHARLHAATEAALDALNSGMTSDGAVAAARQRAAEVKGWADVSPADRRSILSQRVDWYARAGFQVTVMTDTTAQMMRPKHIDTTLVIVLAIISIFAFFIPIVIYLIWYAMRKPDMLSIQIDEYGQVREQAFRL